MTDTSGVVIARPDDIMEGETLLVEVTRVRVYNLGFDVERVLVEPISLMRQPEHIKVALECDVGILQRWTWS